MSASASARPILSAALSPVLRAVALARRAECQRTLGGRGLPYCGDSGRVNSVGWNRASVPSERSEAWYATLEECGTISAGAVLGRVSVSGVRWVSASRAVSEPASAQDSTPASPHRTLEASLRRAGRACGFWQGWQVSRASERAPPNRNRPDNSGCEARLITRLTSPYTLAHYDAQAKKR